MSKYKLTCDKSLKGLVKQITRKYTDTNQVQQQLARYGIFLLQEGTLYRCEDTNSPFCGDTTPRLI